MNKNNIHNINVTAITPIISPGEVKQAYPLSKDTHQQIYNSRQTIRNILDQKDPRLLIIVGPCSIHDPKSALEYAEKLTKLHQKYEDKLFIVMRVYFEKPRTTIGWKGLINDPLLNSIPDLELGLKKARQLLLDINTLGLPCASEFLDPVIPQYISECVAWAAIGARTTESQTHREMASGLSMPVGFKNATNGNLNIAFDAIQSAQNPHTFIGIDLNGHTCTVRSTGNEYCHIVLRGGPNKANYDAETVNKCLAELKKRKLNPSILIDCSHGNSQKDYRKQPHVLDAVIEQRINGNQNIIGVMLESHLVAGNQPFPQPINQLKYGCSITDSCMDWDTTSKKLHEIYQKL